MKRVNNELLKKEFKKINNNLIIGLAFFILSIISTFLIYYDESRTPKDTTYLNEVIEKQNNAENVKANLKITGVYSKIAVLTNETNRGLYVVSDDNYYYLVYMSNEDYNKLKNEDLEKNPQKVYGVTKSSNNSTIKSSAIKWYNLGIEDAKDKITTNDFESYFGGVYLDTTEESGLFIILVLVSVISGICALSFIIVYVSRKIQTSNSLKKIDDNELEKIEKELDDKETFHYEKAHLILTKNYIISFVGKLYIIKYEDIIWIYEHRLRQYGFTTQKSLMVMNNIGKTRAIINVDGVTKKSTSIIKEVVETIYNKNNKILVGYTSENIKQARKLAKENKNKQKVA